MAKSDGSVIIDTKIDTSGFGKGMADAKQKVSAFSSSLNKLGNAIKNTFSRSNTENVGKSYDELRKEIAKAEAQLDKLIEKQIRFVETGGNIKSRTMAGMEYDIEMARKRLEELRSQLSLTSKETPKKVGKMNTWIKRLKNSFDSLNKSTQKSHYSIVKMLGTSLLFSTVFRAISAVTKGFGEGINNLVQYSDEANTSMSALKTSLTQLKNSFATAFMPIITAVTPAVTQFIGLISKATSIVAAFFSALTGNKTYIKAIEVQEDYAESLDKTAESAKKAQKYLSGLDEIRTYTENDSGKSGAVLPDNMFTEEEIDSPIIDFAEKVKIVIDKIKDLIKKEDWGGLGEYISSGIVGALDFLSEKLNKFDWKGLGEDVGEFLSGIEWIEVIKAGIKLKFNIWKAIADVWLGMFETAPFETAFISAISGMKFLGLKNVLKNKIIKNVPKTISTNKTISLKGLKFSFPSILNNLTIGISSAMGTPAFDVVGNWIIDKIDEALRKIIPDWAFEFLSKLGAGIVVGAAAGSWFPGAGTVAGAIVGGIIGGLDGIKVEEGKSILGLLGEKLLNFDHASYWFDRALESFQTAFDGKRQDWMDIGSWIIGGIGEGLVGALVWLVEPIADLFTWTYEEICKVFDMHSPSKKMEPLGENILLGIVEGFVSMFSVFDEKIKDFWEKHVKPWFTKEKWDGILGSVPDSFKEAFKNAANGAIEFLNGVLVGVESLVNEAINALAKIGDSVNLIPGVNIDFNSTKFTIPKIPFLATGAVIPPNAPFMAVLGDQRRGTNIEAPLDTIKQAVREVVGNSNSGGGQYIFSAHLNRRVLFEEFIEEAKLRMSMTGHNPMDLRT